MNDRVHPIEVPELATVNGLQCQFVSCSDHAHAGGMERPDILFVGDPHSHFWRVQLLIQQVRPRAVILLGDLCAENPLDEELSEVIGDTEIWFIHGNHDSDEDRWWHNITTSLEGGPLEGRNLHGRVAEVQGLRVAGLGGVFYGRVWNPRDQMPSVYDWPEDLVKHQLAGRMVGPDWQARVRSGVFKGVYDRLARERADILVTHEAPSMNLYGYQVLDELADRLGVSHFVHGHHHMNVQYSRVRGSGKPATTRHDLPHTNWQGWCVDGCDGLALRKT